MSITDGFKLDESTLHWACSFNNLEVARLLLLSGIPVDVTNNEQQTPLHVACMALNTDMIQLLLSEGASIKSLDISGRNPKDLLPGQSDELQKLLTFPPEPSFELRNAYLKSQAMLEERRAVEQRTSEESEPEPLIQEETSPGDPLEGSGEGATEPTEQSKNQPNDKSPDQSSVSGIAGVLGAVSLQRPESAEDTEDYEGNEHDENDGENTPRADRDTPLLVLWPPTQRQIKRGQPEQHQQQQQQHQQQQPQQQQPLVLSSLETVLVHIACDGADIFPILNWSGLIDALERFNLTTQVKRPTKDSIQGDPKIRFCVDNNLCPGRHRFEIDVKSERVSILASDVTGGLYALYAFIQLLQLHSQLKVYPDGEVALLIFPITLVDYPDINNRAVMWSLRARARCSFRIMREMVELFSELRLNMLFLVVDSTTILEAKMQEEYVIRQSSCKDLQKLNNGNDQNGSNGSQNSGLRKSNAAEMNDDDQCITSHITALDEICDNLCVELVPTVILSSINQRLSLPLLQSFSHTMICLIFTYDLQSVRAEIDEEKMDCEDDRSVSLSLFCWHYLSSVILAPSPLPFR